MFRREFFTFAAGGVTAAPQIVHSAVSPSFTEQIAAEIRRELPDVKSLEITYDPEDTRVPLMILALRI